MKTIGLGVKVLQGLSGMVLSGLCLWIVSEVSHARDPMKEHESVALGERERLSVFPELSPAREWAVVKAHGSEDLLLSLRSKEGKPQESQESEKETVRKKGSKEGVGWWLSCPWLQQAERRVDSWKNEVWRGQGSWVWDEAAFEGLTHDQRLGWREGEVCGGWTKVQQQAIARRWGAPVWRWSPMQQRWVWQAWGPGVREQDRVWTIGKNNRNPAGSEDTYRDGVWPADEEEWKRVLDHEYVHGQEMHRNSNYRWNMTRPWQVRNPKVSFGFMDTWNRRLDQAWKPRGLMSHVPAEHRAWSLRGESVADAVMVGKAIQEYALEVCTDTPRTPGSMSGQEAITPKRLNGLNSKRQSDGVDSVTAALSRVRQKRQGPQTSEKSDWLSSERYPDHQTDMVIRMWQDVWSAMQMEWREKGSISWMCQHRQDPVWLELSLEVGYTGWWTKLEQVRRMTGYSDPAIGLEEDGTKASRWTVDTVYSANTPWHWRAVMR